MNHIILICFVVLVLFALVLVYYYYYQYNNLALTKGTVNTVKCSQLPIEAVVDIETNGAKCLVGDVDIGVYYIPSLNFVVSQYQTDIHTVCQSLCTTFSNGECTGNVEQYKTCLNTLANTGLCEPPQPMGRIGAIYYYPLYPGVQICSNAAEL